MKRIGIAIAGASCSGKTTLANALASELDATQIRIDDYYRPLDHLSYEERCEVNFDDPCAIDSDLLIRQIQSLLSGLVVEIPQYDFTRHTRFAETKVIEPTDFVIVEGLFALNYPNLAEMCDVRVFVDAPESACLERRLIRDTTERGRTEEEVLARFTGHVWPMYMKHVLPVRCRATVCVSGVHHLGQSLDQLLKELRNYTRA